MNACFLNEWKKSKYYPILKKVKNKSSKITDLCHSCLFVAKFLKKIIFNSHFKYLEDNKLLTCNKSGFRPGDSCVHQLLSITHEIYKLLDAIPSLEEIFFGHIERF